MRAEVYMAKKHFLMRLIPPRPTFGADMSAEERGLMQQHIAYVRTFFDGGQVLAYGPVLDPAGAFGVALLEVDDEAEAYKFAKEDPSIVAGLNSYALTPMIIAACQAPRTASPV
jgi:uncharacterized protein